VAKCLLLAMFTYQLAYYAWVKLETDEIRHEKDGTCPYIKNVGKWTRTDWT